MLGFIVKLFVLVHKVLSHARLFILPDSEKSSGNETMHKVRDVWEWLNCMHVDTSEGCEN